MWLGESTSQQGEIAHGFAQFIGVCIEPEAVELLVKVLMKLPVGLQLGGEDNGRGVVGGLAFQG